MTDPVELAIAAAERLVQDSVADPDPTLTPLLDAVTTRLRNGSDPLLADRFGYLVALVVQLRMSTRARGLLDAARQSDPPPAMSATLHNLTGVLAVGAGDYQGAFAAFLHALIDDRHGSGALGYGIMVNLAAAYWRSGRVAQATRWAAHARSQQPPSPDPLAEALLTATEAAIATGHGALQAGSRTAVPHRVAVTRAIGSLDHDDPRSLAMVADLAAEEFDRAQSIGDLNRVRVATETLENLSQLMGATLGDDHPQFAIVLANHASAEFQLALDHGRIEEAREAAGLIRESAELLTRVLNPLHPDVVAATGSLAVAQFELARLERSPKAMRGAIGAIAAAYHAAAQAVGAEHPHTLALLTDWGIAELELARLEPAPDQVRRAATTLRTAVRDTTASFGPEHPTVRRAAVQLHACEALLPPDPAVPKELGPDLRPDEDAVAAATPQLGQARPPEAEPQPATTAPSEAEVSGLACMEVLAEVYVYLDLELGDERRQAISDHLDECSPCLREYGIEQEVKILVARAGGDESAPPALRERLRHRLMELVLEIRHVNYASD